MMKQNINYYFEKIEKLEKNDCNNLKNIFY